MKTLSIFALALMASLSASADGDDAGFYVADNFVENAAGGRALFAALRDGYIPVCYTDDYRDAIRNVEFHTNQEVKFDIIRTMGGDPYQPKLEVFVTNPAGERLNVFIGPCNI